MSEPGGTPPPPQPQPTAPAPGWYHDDHGILRWWDGSGWTEHVQIAEQAPLAPGFEPTPTPVAAAGTGTAGGGPAERSFLPWVIALVSVLALCVAAVLILSSLGGDDDSSEPTDVVPSGDVQDVQSGLSSAQAAIETYAIDHDGSYEGATPEELAAIEPTIAEIPLTVTGQATGYVLSAAAGDTAFTITRDSSGTVSFSCTPPGGSGCDETGTWGTAA